jgi:hypothetical protein
MVARIKTCISRITTHKTSIKNSIVAFVTMLIRFVKLPPAIKWLRLMNPLYNTASPPDRNHISGSFDVNPELSKTGYIKCPTA